MTKKCPWATWAAEHNERERCRAVTIGAGVASRSDALNDEQNDIDKEVERGRQIVDEPRYYGSATANFLDKILVFR